MNFKEPSIDLDRLVAEKVMGWDVHFKLKPGERPLHEGEEHFRDPQNNTIYLPGQWSPSTSEEAALDVVRKMRGDGFSFKLWQPSTKGPELIRDRRQSTVVSFICGAGPCAEHGNPHHTHHGAYDIEGATLSMAVCRAALLAMKVITEEEVENP